MPNDNPTASAPFNRPSARPVTTAMPVQRANYGIPPRREVNSNPAANTVGPRFMDVSAPPQAPRPVAVAPAPIVPTPVAVPSTPTPTPQVAIPQQPLFTPAPAQSIKKPTKPTGLLPKALLVLLIIGSLLSVAGLGRWITAGSTAGDNITVGAVLANDGNKLKIQFTADDGLLHSFNVNKAGSELIPGTAVQIAYQPGAADATAKQVSVVKNAHNLGVGLFSAGLFLLASAGATIWVIRLRHRKTGISPLAKPTPVTV